MHQHEEFNAVIKLRCGGKYVPRIECASWQGRAVRAYAAWPIEDDETAIYKGEFACLVEDFKGERFPRIWIASGDLVRI